MDSTKRTAMGGLFWDVLQTATYHNTLLVVVGFVL